MVLFLRKIAIAVAMATLVPGVAGFAQAAPKKSLKVAWSIYVAWTPWPYANQSGIPKKSADKCGISIELVQINDYVESLNRYTAGAFDGVLITNRDTLGVPAAGGVETVNLKESGLTLVHASDVTALVTWNPEVSSILANRNAQKVFDRPQIPGQIQDLMIVNTGTLKDNPALAKALVGTWYLVIGAMQKSDAASEAARTEIAKDSGTDLTGFDGQLKTRRLYLDPSEAAAFVAGQGQHREGATTRNSQHKL